MISYAVYTLKGDKWWVEKNFPERSKDAAIALAKEIAEASPYVAVKVVREDHNQGGGTFSERVVFKLTPTRPPPSATFMRTTNTNAGRGAVARPGNKATPPPQIEDDEEEDGGTASNSKRVLMLAVSIGVGSALLLATLLTWFFAHSRVPGLSEVGGTFYSWVTYFVVLALAITGITIYKLDPEFFLTEWHEDDEPDPEPDWVPTPAKEAAPAPKADKPAPTEEGKEDKPDDKPQDEDAEAVPAEDDASLPADLQAIEADGGRALATFFADSLQKALAPGNAAPTRAQIFACHLFLAGLTEEVGTARGWPDDQRRAFMLKLLEPITANREQTVNFVQHYEDFLHTAHDTELYEAGKEAARAHLADIPGADMTFGAALKRWSAAAAATAAQPTVVMFTDIVGSTEFAQQHGDARQLDQVRAHDQIVTATVTQYRGRVIKHTGDGAMASFFSISDAMRAAVIIQKAVAAHSRLNPEIPVLLRIGVNSGAALREGEDIFGATVQMAARLCAAAEVGQIMVGPEIGKACQANNVPVEPAGERQFKGFPKPIETFRIKWQ